MAQMRFGAAVLAACLAALIHTSFAATSHTVGGTTGWTIPTSNSLYSAWAAKQTFNVGDTLVFNFQTGTHTVAEVSKSAYDACTTSNPISTAATGPASITLSTAGAHYYICTIPGHCSAGQKVAITASTAAPASPPKSTPASSPSPAASAPTASTPAASPAPAITAPAASPTSAPTAAEPTPSISTSPESSTVPSAMSPSSGTAAPAPSSAAVAGAGFLIPVLMFAAAFFI